MKKRTISLVLALCLVLTFAVPALAADNSGAVNDWQTLSGDHYIKTDGTLWKLSSEETGRPLQVEHGIHSVYAGLRYEAVVRPDGSLRTDWGKNFGDPNVPWSAENPYQVKLPVDDAVYVGCGNYAMGAVTKDGVLWMWGEVPNPFPDLKDYGPYTGTLIDTNVPSFKDPYDNGALRIMDNVQSFCVVQEATAVIRSDGSLWMWGRSDFGALGNGGAYDFEWMSSHYLREPAKVLDNIAEVSLGRGFGAALAQDGSLYVWGSNKYGQQGNGKTGNDYDVDRPVKRMDNVMRVVCYEGAIAAITFDNELYVWGDSYRGAVGSGSTGLVSSPVKIMDDVVDVSFIRGGASRGTLALKRDGTLWAWGSAALLGQGKDFSGNDACVGNGSWLYDKSERLQTTPIKVADNVALPSYCTPSPWAANDVDAAIAAGIVPGPLRNSYAKATTRSEFCALAAALYESINGTVTGRKGFRDTTDVNVEKMAALGVVNGVGDNKFDPDGRLTREQAATMLARLAAAIGKPIAEAETVFVDSSNVSNWARAAVGQMQQSGIMNGVGDNRFDPSGEYTREQSVVTMLRMLGYVKG